MIDVKWYSILGLIGWSSLILFLSNMFCTDYSAGILIYNGFLPEGDYLLLLPFIWLVLNLIWMGATIEDSFGRKVE